MKFQTTGQAIIKHELRKTGRDAQLIESAGGLRSEERTVSIGPFTVESVHAEVGHDMRVTLSENYHSVSVGVTVRIPVDPNEEAVNNGLQWCAEKVNAFLADEMKGARRALRVLARRED